MAFDEKANLSATSAAMKIAVLVATERHPKNFVLIIVVTGLDSCLHSLVASHEYWLYVVPMLATSSSQNSRVKAWVMSRNGR